jgi:hypothetical protein
MTDIRNSKITYLIGFFAAYIALNPTIVNLDSHVHLSLFGYLSILKIYYINIVFLSLTAYLFGVCFIYKGPKNIFETISDYMFTFNFLLPAVGVAIIGVYLLGKVITPHIPHNPPNWDYISSISALSAATFGLIANVVVARRFKRKEEEDYKKKLRSVEELEDYIRSSQNRNLFE